VNDPWIERLLRRPDVRAWVHLFTRLVALSSLAAIAAGVLLLVTYCAAAM